MRRVAREALTPNVAGRLQRRQADANEKLLRGSLDVAEEWKSARQSSDLEATCATLRRMAGPLQRCMYCEDSHGTDVEHFRPKRPFPESMFVWPNLLLCCRECGRFKGDRFPRRGAEPLLIDPTAEDPWQHIDFDPITGNVVARFDRFTNGFSPKGSATVDLLRLDRREAMAEGLKRTFRRLAATVEQFLESGRSDSAPLVANLRRCDDHGLLGWCFDGRGQELPPFRDLRMGHPPVWDECRSAFGGPRND